MSDSDFSLSAYSYELPPDRIAQYPARERGASRLLALSRSDKSWLKDQLFCDLPDILPPDCLLVANNSAVMPARLTGTRPGGGKAEFLLLTPVSLLDAGAGAAEVEGLIRPAAKIRSGDQLQFGAIRAQITAKGNFGAARAILRWPGDLAKALNNYGALPLPPYIRREPEYSDHVRYQTIYASQPGSVAAPTAGLHFTEEIRARLGARDIGWEEISLHVGYGTFSPVRCQDIRQHAMHSEFVEISAATAAAIREAKSQGRPVIAVGTTVVRSLEGAYAENGCIAPFRGELAPFIYPGFQFQVIDGLITNFHLPESTLIMLVSAFIGRERCLACYQEALRLGYRFFSYGDAMLVLP